MIWTPRLHKLILFFSLLTLPIVAFSQSASVLDKKISIQITQKPLGSALKIIEKQAGVNYIYVSGLFNTRKLVSLSVKNATLRAVTRRLIQNNNIELQARGKNIVLLKKGKPAAEKETPALTRKDVPINSSTSVALPMPIAAVIKPQPQAPIQATTPPAIRDTVTIIKHDTVEKPQPEEKSVEDSVVVSTPQKTNSNNKKKWRVGVYASYDFMSEDISQNKALYVLFSAVKNAESAKSDFSAGITLEYKWCDWAVQTGLGFARKRWNVNYNYNITNIDYNNIVGYQDSYTWTVNPNIDDPNQDQENQLDSVAVITRTPIYKKDTVNITYSAENTASYLVVPLQLNFYYPLSKKIDLQLGFGTDLMLLYSSNGMTKTAGNAELESIDKYLKDYYFRLKGIVGLNYSISARSILALQVSYSSDATPIFKSNYAISRTESLLSTRFSYIWCF